MHMGIYIERERERYHLTDWSGGRLFGLTIARTVAWADSRSVRCGAQLVQPPCLDWPIETRRLHELGSAPNRPTVRPGDCPRDRQTEQPTARPIG